MNASSLGKHRPKPVGFWTSFDNLRKELTPICKKLGKMPTGGDLIRLGRTNLGNAILKHHGGFRRVSELLGYQQFHKRPDGSFRDFEALKQVLVPICERFGRMPSRDELVKCLKDDGQNSLEKVIAQHGGRKAIAKQLGLALKKVRLPDGASKDFEFLSKLLLPICKSLGRMPTERELAERGLHLHRAFSQFGGIAAVARQLGYEATETPKNWFKDFSRLKNELLPICKSLGYLPGRAELLEMGRADLIHAIAKHHGGYRRIETKIGYQTCADWVAIDGHRVQSYLEQKVDNVLYSFGIAHVLHPKIKPGARYAGDFSIGGKWIIECLGFDLNNTNSVNCRRYRDQWQKKEALYATTGWKVIKINFNDTVPRIKRKLASVIKEYASFKKQIVSDEEIERPPFEYADFGKVESRLKQHAQEVPGPVTMDGLRAKGEHHLVTCIYRFHGGWQNVAQRLGFTTAQRPKGELKNFERVKECLEKIAARLGHFPSSTEVRANDAGLFFAICKYHRGWHGVAAKMGFSTAQRPSGSLKNFEYVRECLHKLAARLGHFPNSMEVRREDSGLLDGIASHHGGWSALMKRLNIEIKQGRQK
jgi:hypothetical protein